MAIERTVESLQQWASEGALGWVESDEMAAEIISGIAKLRERIEELGGYHDDI